MHDTDFRTVKSKKSTRKCYLINRGAASDSVVEELGDKLKQRLTDIQDEIICTEEFFPVLVEILRKQSIRRLVCLGLGHFSSCPTARVQLALLLALNQSLTDSKLDIQLQDPAFTVPEKNFLRSLDLQVLDENVEGRFTTLKDHPSLYYLPHCPKALTNNLLIANWTPQQLQDSVIICNSFQGLLLNTLERDIQGEIPYVKRIHEFVTEIELKSSERHFDSFNDTSIHWFEADQLGRITDPSFWAVQQSAVVTSDPELITQQLQENLRIK